MKSRARSQIDIDIGFLFSSPILVKNHFPGQESELVEFAKIGWKDELQIIKTRVYERSLEMRLMTDQCTKAKLIDMLHLNPRILQISCHGFYQEEEDQKFSGKFMASKRCNFTMDKNPEDAGLERSMLLFETESADSEFVTALEIRNIL